MASDFNKNLSNLKDYENGDLRAEVSEEIRKMSLRRNDIERVLP